MEKLTKIAVFEGRKIRRRWDEEKEKWYFSVIDIVAALSASETVTKCNASPLPDYFLKARSLFFGYLITN
jgi:hypothetical protein